MGRGCQLVVALALAATSVGCGDDASGDDERVLHPPEWIRGTWVDEDGVDIRTDTQLIPGGLEFTADNVYYYLYDERDDADDFARLHGEDDIVELADDETYVVSYEEATTRWTWQWERRGSSELVQIIDTGGATSGGSPMVMTQDFVRQ